MSEEFEEDPLFTYKMEKENRMIRSGMHHPSNPDENRSYIFQIDYWKQNEF